MISSPESRLSRDAKVCDVRSQAGSSARLCEVAKDRDDDGVIAWAIRKVTANDSGGNARRRHLQRKWTFAPPTTNRSPTMRKRLGTETVHAFRGFVVT